MNNKNKQLKQNIKSFDNLQNDVCEIVQSQIEFMKAKTECSCLDESDIKSLETLSRIILSQQKLAVDKRKLEQLESSLGENHNHIHLDSEGAENLKRWLKGKTRGNS